MRILAKIPYNCILKATDVAVETSSAMWSVSRKVVPSFILRKHQVVSFFISHFAFLILGENFQGKSRFATRARHLNMLNQATDCLLVLIKSLLLKECYN